MLAVDSQASYGGLVASKRANKAFVIPAETFTIESDGEGGELTAKEKKRYGNLSGWLFVGAGNYSQIQGLAAWLRKIDDKFEADDINAYAESPSFDDCIALLIPPVEGGPVIMFEYEGVMVERFDKESIFARGSGMELAIGAMTAGASAEQAIEVASQYDNHTALPIRGYGIVNDEWVELERVEESEDDDD